jgi:Uma2 family endonuclease
MSAVARPKSFEELYREIQQLPEGSRGEILRPGELHITMGRPGRRHRRAAQAMYTALGSIDANVGGAGWWIEVEPEVRFDERLFDPDLAGWRVERVPELPDDNPIEIVPDWCCEVLSPRTAADDVRIKLPNYIAAGVSFVWLIDPNAHLIEVFGPENGRPALVATASDEESVALPPFELPFDPRRLWISPKSE